MASLSSAPRSTLQIACFVVGGLEYGVDIMEVKEIINPVVITAVPRAPTFVEGIIELRGAIMPVVDLRKRFGVEATPLRRETKYIIVPLAGLIVGLVVDAVQEVMTLERGDVQVAPKMTISDRARFFWGVVKQADRMIMLLDVGQVLSIDETAELIGVQQSDKQAPG